MQYLHYLAGPLVGALIGYCTNYIAVKMLFYPHKPIKVFGKTLPLTPGVIPKNQSRLAHAIATAVSDVLLTKDDLAGLITDSHLKSASTALVAHSGMFSERSPEELYQDFGFGEANTDALEDFLTDKVWEGIREMDMGSLIATKAANVVRNNPMLSLLPVGNILAAVQAKIAEFMDSEECRLIISAMVSEKVEELKTAPVGETMGRMGVSAQDAESLIYHLMHGAVTRYLPSVLDMIDVQKIVEDKINAMDIQVFEDLVMGVMKHELNAIINLGFFIGLIIGTINIFL